MKNTLYAMIAACLAMLATSGIVALATAAPDPGAPVTLEQAETELVAHLDSLIRAHLERIKKRIGVAGDNVAQ